MDIPVDLSDITFTNSTSGTVYDQFTWRWVEGFIIVFCFIAVLINLAAFLTLKMYRVCSSAMLITLMTMILGMRVATEGFKLHDDSSNNV